MDQSATTNVYSTNPKDGEPQDFDNINTIVPVKTTITADVLNPPSPDSRAFNNRIYSNFPHMKYLNDESTLDIIDARATLKPHGAEVKSFPGK